MARPPDLSWRICSSDAEQRLSATALAKGADPRSIVTPDAFSVAPALLGTPLAAPWRRFVALTIDLALIGLLRLLGWGVLGGVAALIGLRLATRRSGVTPKGIVGRGALGCVSVLVFGVAAVFTLVGTANIRNALSGLGSGGEPVLDAAQASGGLGFRDVLDGIAGGASLASADSEEEAVTAATLLAEAMTAAGATRVEVRSSLADFVDESTDFDGEEIAAAAVSSLFAGSDAPDAPPARALPPEAMDTVQALEAQIEGLAARVASSERERDAAATALEEAESSSTVFAWVRDAADEAGLIFGWGTVYLTLFLALWNGRTPGKKALDLRVVRLNGEPLSLFLSLERAGGYAAGVATGLLGFAQVLWDPNRQAIHDKIAETVVIREKLQRRLARRSSSLGGTEPNQRTP